MEAQASGGTLSARCCVVGGGPAGMMAGLLLARAGVETIVLEKHGDFLRDFRGDTIHPSTLEVMRELGFLDRLLALPHQKTQVMMGQVAGLRVPVADFRFLPTHCGYIAFMPQWDFLNLLAEEAQLYPTFRLLMETEATAQIVADGRTIGIRATGPEGDLEIRADLVIAADGRHSVIRRHSGLAVEVLGAPMDVLWFQLSRYREDPDETMGIFDAGRIFIAINRGRHWQCGYVIAKGRLDEVKALGLKEFRDDVARLIPFADDRLGEIADWDQLKLLTVGVDRLKHWYQPGLLCIGDAAHTMSPIGGVGINLAIQDAVAASNILAAPLRTGRLGIEHLQAVQKRRMLPTRLTQALQVAIQKRVVTRVLAGGAFKPPLPVRLLGRSPALRRMTARLLGLGVRPEHVRTTEMIAPLRRMS